MGSLPHAGRQPQPETDGGHRRCQPPPSEVLLRASSYGGRSDPSQPLSATGIFVDAPETTECPFSPDRNLCSPYHGKLCAQRCLVQASQGATALPPPSPAPSVTLHLQYWEPESYHLLLLPGKAARSLYCL